MERGALKRLNGYLKGLLDRNPIDAERPLEDRDGHPERKPCAVIGIPYSADIAGSKETEEEKAMKTITK